MAQIEIEAMNGLNSYGTGLFWNESRLIFTGPKNTNIKSRKIVEASDEEILVCGNVPQTTRQTAETNIFSKYFYMILCWGFRAQSTQWGHVERGQFT